MCACGTISSSTAFERDERPSEREASGASERAARVILRVDDDHMVENSARVGEVWRSLAKFGEGSKTHLHNFGDLDLLRPHHVQVRRQISDRVRVHDDEVIHVGDAALLERVTEP